jgi:hypothetical protein
MNSVYLASPTNSTIFTRCCSVAINDDQALCPRCREEVYPGKDATTHQRSVARWNMAYGPHRQHLQYRRSA